MTRGGLGRWAPILGTALAALGYRAVYLAQIRAHPELLQPVLDGAANLAWAREWLEGTWPGNEPYFRAPGAIWGIGVGLAATGGDGVRLAELQILLGAVTPVLVALLAASMFGRAAAWVAGLAAAVYPMFPFHDGQLLDSFLQIPLVVAAVAASWSACRAPALARVAAAGLLWGAAAVVRPPLLLAAAVMPAALLLRAGTDGAGRGRGGDDPGGARERGGDDPGGARERGRAAGLAAAGIVFALGIPSLVSIHNVRCGDPLFLASQGGLNLYLGNARSADGVSAAFPDDPTALGYAMLDAAAREASSREGRALRPSEVSRHYVRRTGEEIRADPGAWARLLAKKLVLFGSAREIPNNHDPALFARAMPILRWSPGWESWAPWGIAGAWLLRRRFEVRLLAAITAAVGVAAVAFFAAGRFRLPAAPLLLILAAAGFVEARRLLRVRALRPAAVFAVLGVGLALALRANPYRLPEEPWIGSYLLVAEAERDRGETMRALGWIERALELEPGSYAARRAQIELLRRAGRVEEARDVALRLVEAAPRDAALRAELGALFDLTGETERALQEIEHALELDPGLDAALVHRGVVLARRGDPEGARRVLETFLRDRPRSPDAPRARAALEALGRGELGPRPSGYAPDP